MRRNCLRSLKIIKNVKLYEYKRDKWTFHAKGVWIYENGKDDPNLTVIGSNKYFY